MNALHSSQLLQLAMPESIVVLAALLALTVDVLFLRERSISLRFHVAAAIGSAGCLAAIARLLCCPMTASLHEGMLLANPLTQCVQIILLALTVLTLWLATPSRFTDHVGEYCLLVLMATVGAMFLVASQDLLVIFIALELLSLSLYILAAMDKSSPRSAEAAFKYFLFGGISAAFLLFGFSLLYGLSNSTNLGSIGASIHSPLDPLLLVALVMVVIGLGTKVAAVPFHFWAPDVYQGAPLPSAAFIASSSRVASFVVLFQGMVVAFAGAAGGGLHRHQATGWVAMLALLAAASMVLGNLAALAQTSVRRLLAYSAIAHAGYLLLAVIAHTPQALAAMLFYLVTYALATLGAFAVVGIVEDQTVGDSLEHFAGLSRRSPLLAWSLMVFLLSLAGIPPLAGFFGKFYLFAAALAAPGKPLALLSLVLLGLGMSAVSLYYYLQVLKRAFVADPDAGASAIHCPVSTRILIALLAAAVVLLGCVPGPMLRWILAAIGGFTT